MKTLLSWLALGAVWITIMICTWKYSSFALYGDIKRLNETVALDESEIKTLQEHQDHLARVLNPQFIAAIKEFTQEVKTENDYLQSFKDSQSK